MAMKVDQELLASLPSQWVTVNGLRMHYRTAGRGQRSVILVHGLTVSGKYLLPTAAKLVDNFTVYIPDLPGFGDSEKPGRVLEIIDMAETLKAWMDAIGLDRAYLLGNSMGCHVVAALAAHHRERVAGIILVSPVGDPDGRNSLRLVLRGLNDFVREPPPLWKIMFQDFLKAGLRRTVLTLRSLQRCRLDTWLPLADVPALVVGGGHDKIVPKWWIGQVIELLPRGEGAVIKEAGHAPNFSHPARLAALVRSFIESSSGMRR